MQLAKVATANLEPVVPSDDPSGLDSRVRNIFDSCGHCRPAPTRFHSFTLSDMLLPDLTFELSGFHIELKARLT